MTQSTLAHLVVLKRYKIVFQWVLFYSDRYTTLKHWTPRINNQEWDASCTSRSTFSGFRDLDVAQMSFPTTAWAPTMMKNPFVVRRCTLLVLRPEIFLPNSRPLLIITARAPRNLEVGGSQPSKSQRSSCIPCYCPLAFFRLLVLWCRFKISVSTRIPCSVS